MDEYLIDLIDRILNPDHNNFDSSKTISWKALREAETVDNSEYSQQLMDYINHEKNKKKRGSAYFILGHIAKNTDDKIAMQYLIHRAEKETDKYILSSLFDRIAELNKPNGTDINPIINAIKNDKWLIRHSAIQALKNSQDLNAEKTLISILETSEDSSNLTYSSATLNKIGSLKAIPFLEKHLKSKKRDVKDSAKFAIEEILKRNKID